MAELEATIKKYAVLPVNEKIARLWGRVRADRKEQPISAQDAFHAATALALGVPLLTDNRKDFTEIPGLQVISEAPPPRTKASTRSRRSRSQPGS
jgi:tRNA(fMet)-specific endonuclease VapC